MVIFQAGDEKRALDKAEAILDLCNRPEDGIIKQATHHLIAEIQRRLGDSQTAVDLARLALNSATGRPDEVAFTKAALARALNDNGQTEEALKQAKEAWTLARPSDLPARAAVEFLSQISNFASQLGVEADVVAALDELGRLSDPSDEVKADKARAAARVFANRQLRQRFLDLLKVREPAKAGVTERCASLPEANAIVVRPLLQLWEQLPEGARGGAYDFWGRGNFARILSNTQRFSSSFNVTLEVRTLDDIKRAIRLWGLYADFLVLLWKGETNSGLAIVPFPEDYEEPGGWGYTVCAGDVIEIAGSSKVWHPAIAWHSIFPDEVAVFLSTEARPFIQAGRLIVVPAVAAACTNPGHGPFEQLLAEAANALPSVRWKGFAGTPIGFVPHSPDAPFELLAELAETESSHLRKLRLLLLRRSRELKPDGEIGIEAKALSLEIEDALRDLEDRNNAFARKRGLAKAKEPLAGATARFRVSGKRVGNATAESPFAPLFILQSLGYGWRVDGPDVPKLPPRFEPQQNDVIGTWLAPPSGGWTIPTVQRAAVANGKPKTGRNEPCPCGSGRKYKKCCGA
jgi:hypothetical protein